MRQEKILVLGGYGGNNVGDDAQLAGALEDLRGCFPKVNLVVLTPHLIQTMRRHWPSAVSFAPRVSFFDFDEDPARYVHFELAENKRWMFERSDFIYENSRCMINNRSNGLSRKQLQLIDEIRSAKLVYYAGGAF